MVHRATQGTQKWSQPRQAYIEIYPAKIHKQIQPRYIKFRNRSSQDTQKWSQSRYIEIEPIKVHRNRASQITLEIESSRCIRNRASQLIEVEKQDIVGLLQKQSQSRHMKMEKLDMTLKSKPMVIIHEISRADRNKQGLVNARILIELQH